MEYLVNAPVTFISAGPVYASVTVESPELALNAVPGQFLHIRCEGYQLRRPISIAGVEGSCVTLVFEIKGGGTQWLSRRKTGDTLDVLGPLGHGFPSPANGPVLLVGGGVGVPPMHFCAQRMRNCDAVLAFRSADRALLTGEMAELCGETLVMTDDGSLGNKGFAAQGVAEMLARKRYGAVFACGPKIMLKTTLAAAQAAGVPCWVSLEERMGCGLGACLTCATPIRSADGQVVMKEACKDGPVFPGEEVVWDG